MWVLLTSDQLTDQLTHQLIVPPPGGLFCGPQRRCQGDRGFFRKWPQRDVSRRCSALCQRLCPQPQRQVSLRTSCLHTCTHTRAPSNTGVFLSASRRKASGPSLRPTCRPPSPRWSKRRPPAVRAPCCTLLWTEQEGPRDPRCHNFLSMRILLPVASTNRRRSCLLNQSSADVSGGTTFTVTPLLLPVRSLPSGLSAVSTTTTRNTETLLLWNPLLLILINRMIIG